MNVRFAQSHATCGGAPTLRYATPQDLVNLLQLYTHLHDNPMPDELPEALWQQIMADPNHHIIVAEQDGQLVSSCVLVVVPNLTRGQRPYAWVENVVTHADYRKRGLGSAVLAHAKDIAMQRGCYKIALMTGTKSDATLRFYESAGYNCTDKTGYIQWL
ncbi:MAG: GNAT family N-acetyltransferase [Oscillospiraceae bacterium]|nr:GNAT family N-acetyltransferase [Oscillospiraceae bacterium]